jgi:hypothetical protein
MDDDYLDSLLGDDVSSAFTVSGILPGGFNPESEERGGRRPSVRFRGSTFAAMAPSSSRSTRVQMMMSSESGGGFI